MSTNLSVFRLLFCCLTAAALLAPASAFADETTRRVQEELRKRRLYNGDIDGQQSPEFGVALKRYQDRKGFPASGVPDAQTLRSLGIAEPAAEVPILPSDVAPPATENPAPTQMSIAGDINVRPPSREELHDFARRYFAASETDTVSDELALCAPRVDYFHHGIVPKTYVRDQLLSYIEEWPQRRYTMDDHITLTKRGDNTAVTALVHIELAHPGQNRKAGGKVSHTIVLARQPDSDFEIVGIEEKPVSGGVANKHTSPRRSSKKKRSSGPRLTPLDRTLRKFFRGR